MEWLRGIESESLRRGLLDCGLRDLPSVYCDGAGFWLRGLVLMERVGGVCAWCSCERDGRGVMHVVKDYSPVPRRIVGVVRIHAIEYLDEVRYGVSYRDEFHCREYLEHFHELRRSKLLGAGGMDVSAYARLNGFVDSRVTLCRTGGVDDLLWLDRERMILCQREVGVSDLMVGVDVGVASDAVYGNEVRTLSSGASSSSPRRVGRPRKDSSGSSCRKVGRPRNVSRKLKK